MRITREPMDEAGRAELEAAAASPTSDLPSRMVIYAAYLVMVPAVLGGLLGTLLAAVGVPLDPAMGGGLLVGLAVGSAGAARFRAREAGLASELRARLEQDRREGQLERIELSPVARAWEVEGFDEEGAAYLLQGDGDPRCLFLVSGTLSDAPGLVPGETFPGTLVRVRRLPHSGRIVDLAVEGDPLPLASPDPRPLPFDPDSARECEILPGP